MKKRNKLINSLDTFINQCDGINDTLHIKGTNPLGRMCFMFIGSIFVFVVSLILVILMCIPQLIVFIYNKINNKRIKVVIEEGLNKHQEELLNEHKYLYLEHHNNSADFRGFSLEFFIRQLITYYNGNCNTLTEKGELQCYRNKRRSLGDIFLICKFYYSDCTIKEVLKCLIVLADQEWIYASYCNTINKFVFHVQSTVTNYNTEVEWLRDTDIKFKQIIEIYKYESNKLSKS